MYNCITNWFTSCFPYSTSSYLFRSLSLPKGSCQVQNCVSLTAPPMAGWLETMTSGMRRMSSTGELLDTTR